MLPLCKFYRYLIYRLYHFRDDTPIINTIITLGVVHWSILLSFRIVIEQFVHIDPIIGSSKESNIIFAIFWFALHYILFYNKVKWNSYDKEFKDETPKQRKKGLILVLSYLIGSVIIFFAIHIIIGLYQDSLK